MDDLYWYATAGSMTHPQGDVAVHLLLPSGNGNSSGMLGSDGNSTDNYLLVDEPGPNGDADYVSSDTPGVKDTYVMGDLIPTVGTVLGVKAVLTARKDAAGAGAIQSVYRLSGTEVDGASVALTTSHASYVDPIQTTKPGGGAWSIADVNAVEIGVKVA